MTSGSSPGWRPRLRTVFRSVNLIVLVLPHVGVGILRLYESALIRQTKSALLGQAALIAATYRAALIRALDERGEIPGTSDIVLT